MNKQNAKQQIPKEYQDYRHTWTDEGDVFYWWSPENDKKIKDGFEWDSIFDIPSATNWVTDIAIRDTGHTIDFELSGYIIPEFSFIISRLPLPHPKPTEEYKKAIKLFDLSKEESVHPDTITRLDTYRQTLYRQMNRQVERAKQSNQRIANILKVFYFETYKKIEKEIGGLERHQQQKELSSRIGYFFKGVLEGMDLINIRQWALNGAIEGRDITDMRDWHPYSFFSNQYTPDHIKQSTLSGIAEADKVREPILQVATKFAGMIEPLETIIKNIIMDDKVMSAEEYAKMKDKEKQLQEEIRKREGKKTKKFDQAKTIATRISSKKSSPWSKGTIEAFLLTHLNNEELSVSDIRDLAINQAKSEKVKTELTEVESSVLYYWRKKIKDKM